MRGILIKLILISCFTCTNAWGVEYFQVKPNEVIIASVAKNGITRIAFDRDRITKVIGNDNLYQIDGDNETGQIFLTPKLIGKIEKIHLTIMSEKGLVQDITLLLDKNIDSQTIVLNEYNSQKLDSKLLHIEQSRRNKVTELIKAISDEESGGSSAYNLGFVKKQITYDYAKAQFDCEFIDSVESADYTKYKSNEFEVYILPLSDSLDQDDDIDEELNFDEEIFNAAIASLRKCKNVISISLNDKKLYVIKSSEVTSYVVMSHER